MGQLLCMWSIGSWPWPAEEVSVAEKQNVPLTPEYDVTITHACGCLEARLMTDLCASGGSNKDTAMVTWGHRNPASYLARRVRARPPKKRSGLAAAAAALSGRSARISQQFKQSFFFFFFFFSAENKLGSQSKRLFKKQFLCASSKEPRLVNRQRIHSANHCRRYKRLELHHNKGRGGV